ncbi:biotin--[acetyl-CoA-carboxylase] ligase [Marimonas sp. MJW-29]|uniref:biotin--[biotin carboxyl-carrier protein] ligase n=1 Tax=Sulfitobacter sediminis TaxID=3234186 RepID=A0ABV3RJN4_9RHOB
MSTDPGTSGGWPDGVGRVILDEIDSTNAEAARRAPTLGGPTWIFTHRQTQGRGRRGRAWTDPAGNFAATLVFKPNEPLRAVALNSFVAAISLREALNALAPSDGYSLKWPNDVLLNGAKIAGILLESAGNAGQVDWLAIGIGVNLRAAPEAQAVEPGALRASSVEAELGVRIDPLQLLDLLAINMDANRRLMQTAGFDAIRRIWLSHAARRGEVITARTMRDEIRGTFEDVDAEGNLILRTAGGEVAVTAADVFF